MTNTLQPSPMIEAVDLLRINPIGLPLDELEAHAERVRGTMLGLMDSIMRAEHMSANAAANVRHLLAKLRAHLAALLSFIEDCKVQAAAATEPPPKDTANGAAASRGIAP